MVLRLLIKLKKFKPLGNKIVCLYKKFINNLPNFFPSTFNIEFPFCILCNDKCDACLH